MEIAVVMRITSKKITRMFGAERGRERYLELFEQLGRQAHFD
jgi:hypothetical protein